MLEPLPFALAQEALRTMRDQTEYPDSPHGRRADPSPGRRRHWRSRAALSLRRLADQLEPSPGRISPSGRGIAP